VTKKNRKARRLQELYPDIKIRVFYQRDYLSLLMKYGLEPPSQLIGLGEGEAPPFWLTDSREPATPSSSGPAAEEPAEAGRSKQRPKSA
jgi:hypothetical protein